MTNLQISRHFISTDNMGDMWTFFGELYFIPTRPCMTRDGVCGCGGPQKWFALDECVPFNGEPVSITASEFGRDTTQVLIYDRAAVMAACPVGMAPAEVNIETYEDGKFVNVNTFLN